MKNFVVLISRLDIVEERNSDLDYISMETPETEKQREKGPKKKKVKHHSQNCGTIIKGVTYISGHT